MEKVVTSAFHALVPGLVYKDLACDLDFVVFYTQEMKYLAINKPFHIQWVKTFHFCVHEVLNQ